MIGQSRWLSSGLRFCTKYKIANLSNKSTAPGTETICIYGDIVGPPNPVSNIRPIRFHIPKNESSLEKVFRLKKEYVQKWHEEFWSQHNLKFNQERKEFERMMKNTRPGRAEMPLTADEISVFYKAFLDKHWTTHFWYNIEWYRHNVSLLTLALRVQLDRVKDKSTARYSMMKQEDVQFTLDDAPERGFEGATLQIENDGVSKKDCSKTNDGTQALLNEININDSDPPPLKARPKSLALLPWSGENAKDYFCNRNGLVSNAVEECKRELLTPDDGELIGSWLLTEISLWDNEKERLVLLTSRMLISVKYDFIALRHLDVKKVPLDMIDTVIIGDLTYPSKSLIPHIDGLATGVTSLVKGCLVRPLQERWAGMPAACSNTNAFHYNNFEARPRNLSGIRIMWNQGKPVPFVKKWNPFEKDIPFNTYTFHPLLWHCDDEKVDKKLYNVYDFSDLLIETLDRRIRTFQCSVHHRSILLENYVGVGALIHNKNSLGFFKVRGKFSF